MTPSVSVVVPSYNHAKYVAQTLRSILAQTRPDLELFVVDDGSTDNSVDEIRALLAGQRDSRVQLEAQSNRGLSRTLNSALARSRGKYFSYVGSDDLWEPDRIQCQVAAMEAAGPNTGASYTDCWVIDAEGRRRDRLGRQYRFLGGDIYRDLVRMRFHPPSPTNMFVREKLILVGAFAEELAVEDRDAWLRVARLHRVVYVNRALASFRTHETNTSTSFPLRMYHANEATFSSASRVDPALAPWRRLIRARNRAGMAAHFYLQGDGVNARQYALRSMAMFPLDWLAWRILVRSTILSLPLARALQRRCRQRSRST